MKYKLESRLLENINSHIHVDHSNFMAEIEEINSFLINMKEENENVGLKLNIQKIKIIASGPFTSW